MGVSGVTEQRFGVAEGQPWLNSLIRSLLIAAGTLALLGLVAHAVDWEDHIGSVVLGVVFMLPYDAPLQQLCYFAMGLVVLGGLLAPGNFRQLFSGSPLDVVGRLGMAAITVWAWPLVLTGLAIMHRHDRRQGIRWGHSVFATPFAIVALVVTLNYGLLAAGGERYWSNHTVTFVLVPR
jgi:hypothetical protein